MDRIDDSQPLKHWGPAILISLAVHAFALYLILRLPPVPAPPKRVVDVDAVCLRTVTPQPAGGGQPAGGPQVRPEVAPPPPPPKPAPPPKPKKQVKPPPAPVPEPVPVPPALALPRPAPPAAPVKTTAGLAAGKTAPPGRGAGSSAPGSGSGAGSGTGAGAGGGTGTGRGAGSGSALQGYLHQVKSILERNKSYPPMARRRHEEGVVVVSFTISADGAIAGVSIARSSGHSLLDQAAQETVSRTRKFPPIPAELQRSQLKIEVPLSFRLHKG